MKLVERLTSENRIPPIWTTIWCDVHTGWYLPYLDKEKLVKHVYHTVSIHTEFKRFFFHSYKQSRFLTQILKRFVSSVHLF